MKTAEWFTVQFVRLVIHGTALLTLYQLGRMGR